MEAGADSIICRVTFRVAGWKGFQSDGWVCGLNVLKNFTTFSFKNNSKLKTQKMIGPQKRHTVQRMSEKTAFKDSLENKMDAKTREEDGCKKAPKGRNISPAAARSCDHN